MDDPRWKALVALVSAGALGLACASSPPEQREAARLAEALKRALAAQPADAGLRVLLAFGSGADLDLYVTDPLEETVYFANSPSVSGGALEADLHCGSPGAGDRVEVIRFAAPLAGRYRVGVDHPKACGRGGAAGFALGIARGGELELHTGSVRLLEFRLAALDFEVAPR